MLCNVDIVMFMKLMQCCIVIYFDNVLNYVMCSKVSLIFYLCQLFSAWLFIIYAFDVICFLSGSFMVALTKSVCQRLRKGLSFHSGVRGDQLLQM